MLTVLPADLIIVGIGIEPETMLAAAAGLALDNGIVVNGQGRTSAAGIWAAGDCAAFPAAGGWMRLESVGNAIDMGEIVARNILGEGVDYLPAPWFWSDQYDIKLQIAGLNTGHDQVVPRQDEGRSHWYFRQDRLIAVDAMNAPRSFMVGRRLLERGLSPDPELIANPATDLKSLLRR